MHSDDCPVIENFEKINSNQRNCLINLYFKNHGIIFESVKSYCWVKLHFATLNVVLQFSFS